MVQCLVVDDAPAVRLAVRHALDRMRPARIETKEAPDLETAKALVAQRVPDVVFLDLVLGQDGQGAAQWGLELLQEHTGLALVVFTSVGREDPRVDGLIAHGCYEHLRKPVRAEQVAGVVRSILHETMGIQRIT